MPIPDANLEVLSAFAEIAAEFCRFIDSLRAGKPKNLYTTLEAILPRLQQGILPVQKEMAEQKHPEFDALRMTHEQWEDIADVIGKTVAPETKDLSSWHEENLSDDPGVANLAECAATHAMMLWDDLADIYRDLQDGLSLWRTGTPDSQAEAAWQWRWGYEYHWGEHLFRAMLTVHEIYYQFCQE